MKATGRERSTDPLHPPDRRIVHLALAGDAEIRTYTVGEGTYRNVVIAPADSRSSGRGGRDRHGAARGSGRADRATARVGGGDDEDDEE